MNKIRSQNGIEAARRLENTLHPEVPVTKQPVKAWDKRAATLTELVAGHNETADTLSAHETRLAALEAALRPFGSGTG